MSQNSTLHDSPGKMPTPSPKSGGSSPFSYNEQSPRHATLVGAGQSKLAKPFRFSTTKLIENVLNYKESIMRALLNNRRTDSEAWALYDYLKEFRFFKEVVNPDNFEMDAILQICKSLKYEKYPKGQPIFVQGDASNGKVYILLSGELYVLVKKLDSYAEQNMKAATIQEEQEGEEDDKNEEKLFDASSNSQSQTQDKNMEEVDTIIESNKDSRRLSFSGNSDDKSDKTPKDANGDSSLGNESLPKDVLTGQLSQSQLNNESMSRNEPGNPEETSPRCSNAEGNSKDWNSFPSTPISNGEENKEFFQFKRPTFKKRTTTAIDSATFRSFKAPKLNKKTNESLEKRLEKEYGFVKDKIERGSYFGEKALETDQKRGATIYPITNCEVLYLTKDIFNSLKSIYDKEKKALWDFIFDYIPGIDQIHSKDVIESLLYLFGKTAYELGHHICHEGKSGDSVYIIYEGTCEVYRTIMVEEPNNYLERNSRATEHFAKNRSTKEKISLAQVGRGTFIGEEIIAKTKGIYRYSVQVVSKDAKILEIKQSQLRRRFPLETFTKIKELYLEKQRNKDKKLLEQMIFRGLNLISTDLDTIPVIAKRPEPPALVLRSNKINSKVDRYQSLKHIAPAFADSPKNKEMLSKSPDSSPKGLEKDNAYIKAFSRYHFMPTMRNGDRSLSGEKSETSEIVKLSSNKYALQHLSNKRRGTESIRSNDTKDIKSLSEFYEKIEEKFNIVSQFETERQKVHDVDYFKMDFGFDSAIEKKNRAERLKLYKSKHPNKGSLLSFHGSSILLSVKRNSLKGLLSNINSLSETGSYSFAGSNRNDHIFMTEPSTTDRAENSYADSPNKLGALSLRFKKSSTDGSVSGSVSSSYNKYSDRKSLQSLIRNASDQHPPPIKIDLDGGWMKVGRKELQTLSSSTSASQVSMDTFFYFGLCNNNESSKQKNGKSQKSLIK